MPVLEGFDAIQTRLEQWANLAKDANTSVIVGYTQYYAIFVHENREVKHKVGRAGYLMDVAHEIQQELQNIVATVFKKTKNMVQALLLAGLRLQRESQLNVPVDTGALKASAFTKVDEEGGK